MLKINKIYMMIAIMIPLNACTTFSDYYNDYYGVTVEDKSNKGSYKKIIATNDEYFVSGQFYKENIEKLQKYDIDINSISNSGVTVYDLDAEIVKLEPVKNSSYDNVSNIMQNKIVLVPPSKTNNNTENSKGVTIYSVSGAIIHDDRNRTIEVPSLLPPMNSDNNSYSSPFMGDDMKMSGKPRNILTK